VAGVCVGAIGAVAIISNVALNQIYYLVAAVGAFGIAAALGIERLVPDPPRSRGPVIAVLAALGLGWLTVSLVRALGPQSVPTIADARTLDIAVPVLMPLLALIVAAVIAFAILRSLTPRVPWIRGSTGLLVVALVMGYSLPGVANVVAKPFGPPPPAGVIVPGDGIDAARWLRANSDPDDLVATNLHCGWYATDYDRCNPVSFWVSAYSERRVLVEGWTYTIKTEVLPSGNVAPFWDPGLLAANDLAFTNPSAVSVAKLRDEYGVRWLLADLTGAAPDLGTYASLRYRAGDYAVYELTSQ